jgi:uncharacterized protein YcfJ
MTAKSLPSQFQQGFVFKAAVAAAALVSAGLANAQVPTPVGATGAVQLIGTAPPPANGEYGRVLSSTPVVQQVSVPKQVCAPAAVKERSGSPAGAVVGAIAGGAIGNAIGHGNGKASATGLGMMGGAILGSMIGSSDNTRAATACSTQTITENRTVGYNVVYEYAGKQYQTQMPKDPGAWIQLQIQPVVPGAVTTSAPIELAAPLVTTVPSPVTEVVVANQVAPVYIHPVAPLVVSPAVVYTTPVVRPAVALSVPIVVGHTRYVQPVTRVVVHQAAPVVVHHAAPVVVHRAHGNGHGHARGHGHSHTNHVVEVVAPRVHRPGKVVPDAVITLPGHPHIKGGQDRQYY